MLEVNLIVPNPRGKSRDIARWLRTQIHDKIIYPPRFNACGLGNPTLHLPDSSNTSAKLDHSRDKLERSQLELVISLIKVTLLRDVNSSTAPVVLYTIISFTSSDRRLRVRTCTEVSKAIELLITTNASVG